MTMARLRQFIGIGLVAGLSLMGCQKGSNSGVPGKLMAAKLDTLPILQQDTEYQKLAEKYTKDNLELSQRIRKQVDSGKLSEEQAAPEYLKAQDQLNKKWMTATNEFIQTRHGKMREVVEQLCKEKGIDIVLIDSQAYRTVKYGALDITQDVLMKIHGGSGLAPASESGSR